MAVRFFLLGDSDPENADPGPTGRILVRRRSSDAVRVERRTTALRVLLRGEERYEIDGRMHRLVPGHFLVTWPGAAMTRHVGEREPAMGLTFDLPPAPAAPVADPEPLPGGVVLPLGSHPIGAWLHDLAGRMLQEPGGNSAVAAGALADGPDAAARLDQDTRDRLHRLGSGKHATRLDLLRRVEVARMHLQATVGRVVPLAELAARANVSLFHLARRFREVHGQSPAAYHRGLRLDHAAELLGQGVSIPAAMEATGFVEQAGFTRAYAKRHGVTPGRARAG